MDSPDIVPQTSMRERESSMSGLAGPMLSRSSSYHVITVAANSENPSRPSVTIERPLLGEDPGSEAGDAPPADGLEQPLIAPAPESSKPFRRQLTVAYNISWAVNIFLLGAKVYAFYITQSKAVLASLVDTVVDIASQGVIAWAEHEMAKKDPRFPVGRARLEALGVLACACIMSVSAFQVINSSAEALYLGLAKGSLPFLDVGLVMYLILGGATALKLLCYAYCSALRSRSDAMTALAEDHLNDIFSNMAAVASSTVAAVVAGAWWVDAAGAIVMSLYIVWRWAEIAKAQVDKIVGRAAPEDFTQQLEALVAEHHDEMELDVVRAYHFGSRYLVELEVVLPQSMRLAEAHDISLALQHKVEDLEQVERAFVHCDYQRRTEPEHKVERMMRMDSNCSS